MANAPKDTIFLELRPEVKIKVTVTQEIMLHSANPRCIHIPNLGSLPQIILEICSGHDFSRMEVKVTYPHVEFGIPTSKNIGDMLQIRIRLGQTEAQANS